MVKTIFEDQFKKMFINVAGFEHSHWDGWKLRFDRDSVGWKFFQERSREVIKAWLESNFGETPKLTAKEKKSIKEAAKRQYIEALQNAVATAVRARAQKDAEEFVKSAADKLSEAFLGGEKGGTV